MSSNNLEGINKKINESITEINNTMEKKKNSLITINKNLNTIKDRIIELKGKLESNKKDINAELEKAKQEANNNTYLTDMIKKIQGLLEKINLDKNIEELDQQNSAIEKAINDKVKEARDKELQGEDNETKAHVKDVDEAAQNKNVVTNESQDDLEFKEMFKGMSDETREQVNEMSRQFKIQNPGLYETFKNNLRMELEQQKDKDKLTDKDIKKLINQNVITTKNGNVVKNESGPMKNPPIYGSSQVTRKAKEQREEKLGGKRTRKRRRNSRKKKVVKRR